MLPIALPCSSDTGWLRESPKGRHRSTEKGSLRLHCGSSRRSAGAFEPGVIDGIRDALVSCTYAVYSALENGRWKFSRRITVVVYESSE